MTAYKQIQLTNTTVGDVPVDAYIPLGKVTRRINAPMNCCNTFGVTSSNNDTVTLNDTGFYKVTYSLTATANAEGTVTIALVFNGTSVYTVSQYIADATAPVSLTLPYTVRVTNSNDGITETLPATIQILNTETALTGSSGNLIIEKI
jgi:hypothetical protein